MNQTWVAEEIEGIAAAAEWFAAVINYPERGQAAPPAPAALLANWLPDADALAARRDPVTYCSLFDIGNPQPPVPLLENHYHPDGHTRLRRVVNFYRAFGVTQDPAQAPDHLCVELAFLAYLARVALMYPLRSDLLDAVRTFARLHPGSIVGKCAQELATHDSDGVYAALFTALEQFLRDVGGDSRIPVMTTSAAEAVRHFPEA